MDIAAEVFQTLTTKPVLWVNILLVFLTFIGAPIALRGVASIWCLVCFALHRPCPQRWCRVLRQSLFRPWWVEVLFVLLFHGSPSGSLSHFSHTARSLSLLLLPAGLGMLLFGKTPLSQMYWCVRSTADHTLLACFIPEKALEEIVADLAAGERSCYSFS